MVAAVIVVVIFITIIVVFTSTVIHYKRLHLDRAEIMRVVHI